MAGTGLEWPQRSFIGRLAESDRNELLRLGVRRPYEPGRVVLAQGEGTRHVVVLLKGYVKVTTTTPGYREALLAIRGPGDIVGELAAVSGADRSATVTTCGRVESRLIPQRIFERFLADRPATSRHLVTAVGDKLSSADRSRAEFVALPARARVASVLCDLSAVFGGGTDIQGPIQINVTQPELASMAGIREVTIHKELREMRDAGAIATGYRQITVVDLAMLRGLRDQDDEDTPPPSAE